MSLLNIPAKKKRERERNSGNKSTVAHLWLEYCFSSQLFFFEGVMSWNEFWVTYFSGLGWLFLMTVFVFGSGSKNTTEKKREREFPIILALLISWVLVLKKLILYQRCIVTKLFKIKNKKRERRKRAVL